MSLAALDRPLLWGATVHALLAVACAAAFLIDAPPILGVHPAVKPLKFAVSIAIFLATMAVLVPTLSIAPWARQALAWTLVATMAAEMVPIVAQALRGTTSHFNTATGLDARFWNLMLVAILIATVAIILVALAATARPLVDDDGPLAPLVATAWRAGLWLFLLAAVSGFGMGGRGRHTIGGDDGGPGMAVTNWSTRHGDLRVSHFFALHALQVLPLVAIVVARLPLPQGARWAIVIAAIAAQAVIVIGTLAQAFAARPLW
ncbi:MAG: hypothetical protein K8W52_29650 [Deltaproteobacteria bacterium]|nr:hypothetical protein [Deltaproteobacteria bacterium]